MAVYMKEKTYDWEAEEIYEDFHGIRLIRDCEEVDSDKIIGWYRPDGWEEKDD